jgi:hypothetical protein
MAGRSYPDRSKWIRHTKGQINNQTAHANIVSADATFRAGQTADVVDLPFFDAENEHFVKADLGVISSVALGLMRLFYAVTEDVARATGRSVLEFRLDFPSRVSCFEAERKSLRDEIKGSDFYKTAMRKEKERSEKKAKLGDETTTVSPRTQPSPVKPKPTRS